ncbi:hypothetical protein [Terrilactibacillus tamarindi]|nr:hypothetical protein [Terrilactibacillus tamarindi]
MAPVDELVSTYAETSMLFGYVHYESIMIIDHYEHPRFAAYHLALF